MPACRNYDGRRCINQMIRPSFTLPAWCRPPGMGDCRTCKPCIKNTECDGYYPAPELFVIGENNDDGPHGDVDATSGIHNGSSRDSTGNKAY